MTMSDRTPTRARLRLLAAIAALATGVIALWWRSCWSRERSHDASDSGRLINGGNWSSGKAVQ